MTSDRGSEDLPPLSRRVAQVFISKKREEDLMTATMTPKTIALKDLELHSQNVRAKSPETYAPENIAHLMASIAAVGLIQPLVIQKQKKGYGVLAGGRRLAALKALAEAEDTYNHAIKVTASTKIDCREVPADCDLATTISLVENLTQAAMSPIDEFEAFAAMMELDGQTPQTIALTFGTTIAAVQERLRYGRVHEDIRAAVRAKALTLDAMKAFGDHPCQNAQLEIYRALTAEDDRPVAWQVRKAIKEHGLQASDSMGRFILEEYRAADGAIASDLLGDTAILEDMDLVGTLLEAKLAAIAEEERVKGGFAWAETMVEHDWQALQKFGRIYPGPIDLDEAAQARVDAIAAEVSNLEERADAEDLTEEAYEKIWAQIEALNDEADDLQTAYDTEQLKTAGVIVSWQNGVTVSKGLVRPEDKKGGSGKADAKAEDVDPSVIIYAASLEADLKTERGMALGAALASSPEVATDLAMFKVVCDVVLSGASVTQAFEVRAATQYHTHAKLDEIDQTAANLMEEACSDLSLDWAAEDRSSVEMFASFRALEAGEKAKLVAYAVGKSTKPCFAREERYEPLMGAIEAEVMPDVRAFWRPNAAFFARLKKAQLIGILTDLGLTQEALNLASSTKREVFEFLDALFTEPFATLTPEQRAAVDAWCPPGMQTAEVKVLAMKPAKKTAKAKGKTGTKKAA